MHNWQISPLSTSKHICSSFSCGEQILNEYIKKYASQDIKKNIAKVFVTFTPNDFLVIGYYTLSATSFEKKHLPPEIAKKLPHYPVPAAIIGRLAVDESCQGKGLGKFLLMDAFYKVLLAKNAIAVNAIVVDAKNQVASSFYKQYGFLEFPKNPKRLFLPIATIEKIYQ